MLSRKQGLWAAVLAMAVAGTVRGAEDPSLSQMKEQLKQLQAKVDQLEAKDTAKPAVAPVLVDSATTAKAVEADAERNTPRFDLGTSFSGGWEATQFVIRSENGDFTLHPGLTADFRNMTNYREQIAPRGGGETGSTGYDTQNGFDISRLRLIFDGKVFGNLGYYVQLSADQGSALTLLDAYGIYRFGESPFSVKLGQFKDPICHERNLSEARLMAVDRSLLEAIIGGGQGSRIQGVSLIYDKDIFRGQAVFHDGFNSQNTKFFDAGGVGAGVTGAAGVTPDNFGASGRGEVLLIGDRDANHHPFQEYDGGFTSLGFDQATLIVGGGVDFTQASSNDVILHTVDLQFNLPGGLSAYAGYLGTYRALHTNQGVAPGYYFDPGFIAQVAYLFKDKYEPFVRYDYTHLDPASVTGLSTRVVQELTVGANYYLYKQNVKLTVDGSYLPNGSPVDSDALGVLRDVGRNEFLLRAQAQLAI